MPAFIQTLDEFLMLWIQDNLRGPVSNAVMIFFTTLGNSGAIWLVLGTVLLFFKKHRRLGLTLILSIAFCYVLNDLVIKHLMARPRPFLVIEGLTTLVRQPSSWSFPSGHACSSFVSALILTRAWGKRGAWFYLLAVMIALSRPFVGVHYVSDILVGAANGTLGGLLCWTAAGRIRARRSGEQPFPPSE